MKKINSETHNFSEEEDLIDFLLIFKNLWKNRIQISRSTIAFFIIGCIVALTSPVIYEAQTTFVPQTSDENSSATKGLGSLASLAGINLNAEASSSIDNYISPLLYSKIIANGYTCKSEPLIAPGGKAKILYCHDPDGAILELIEDL